MATQKEEPADLKTLAEGSHSSITDQFVAVIRDDETYTKLRKMQASLPQLEADFFRLHTVVAAFLGRRNTGGYSVEISRGENGKIRVAEKTPAKRAMTIQVLTSPFKIVSIASKKSTAVELSIGQTFQQRAQHYRISSGTFSMSGGFTGRTESFQLRGKLQVTRLGDLITIGFAVVSSGGARERSLRDFATGVIKDGLITIERLSHGSMLDPPSAELQVSGRFPEKNKLVLEIASKPFNVPENYNGRGSIEAELVAASAN
ncbi:MAG TPA: protease complex subunit PrcB family protein [Pyrinomonadaceae bacterium]|nr:protease complex subunit PrcB family protein [Pyrinomonadaceae bacterium]